MYDGSLFVIYIVLDGRFRFPYGHSTLYLSGKFYFPRRIESIYHIIIQFAEEEIVNNMREYNI